MNQNNPTQYLMGKEITVYRKNLGLDRDIIIKRQHYHALSDFKPKHNKAGQRICLNCNKIIKDKRKRKYCSTECSSEFFAKHNSAGMRSRIFMRDKDVCQKCGVKALFNINSNDPMSGYNYVVDHIKPIALGGAEFDENNLQLLCGTCNKEKTKLDQALIAKKRAEIRLVRNPFRIPIKLIFSSDFRTLESFSVNINRKEEVKK
jgi:5-methylcytosine-specific restriction endonuclease McrA